MLRRPTPQTLAEIARDLDSAAVTYTPIGATITGDLPAGYVHDDVSASLGVGGDVFDDAKRLLQNWAAHRGSGLVVSEGASVEEGTTVALSAPLPIARRLQLQALRGYLAAMQQAVG